jgi:Ferritin-like domain
MKYVFTLAALAAIASAGPVVKRQSADITNGLLTFFECPTITQLTFSSRILNYALTLEHLEDKLYREGLANYTKDDSSRLVSPTHSTTT